MNGDFKIHGGDFISGIVDTNQYVYGFFLLKVKGKLFREKIPISFVMNLEIATEESVKKLGGTLGWGLVGGALLGPLGLLVGLLAGGKRNDVTFICIFRDGRKFIATVSLKLYKLIMGDWLSSRVSKSYSNLSDNQYASRNEKNDDVDSSRSEKIQRDIVVCKKCGANNFDASGKCWACGVNLSTTWEILKATPKYIWWILLFFIVVRACVHGTDQKSNSSIPLQNEMPNIQGTARPTPSMQIEGIEQLRANGSKPQETDVEKQSKSNGTDTSDIINKLLKRCATEAGIPVNSSSHAITPDEMKRLTVCVDSKMNLLLNP